MKFAGDPYRTLGVAPGASLNEIRSAYRRLVKQYHPDAAGERALPRFLSIQAAYEGLVDGEGHLRPAGTGSGATTGRGPAPGASRGAGEPSRADQARARASRDAWRARRTAAAGDTATAAGRASTDAGPGPSTAGGGSSGRRESGPPGGDGARGTERGRAEPHARRGPRKATPGSTTYDEAAEIPLDPEWDGGAWYGPSSGTYWTINPREYADPRKHGPEYLARAQRAAAGEAAAGGTDPAAVGGTDPTGEPPGAERSARGEADPAP